MKKIAIVSFLILAALVAPIFSQEVQPVCVDSSATASSTSLFEGSAFLSAWANANQQCADQGKVAVDAQHSMNCGILFCTATTTVRCRCPFAAQ